MLGLLFSEMPSQGDDVGVDLLHRRLICISFGDHVGDMKRVCGG